MRTHIIECLDVQRFPCILNLSRYICCVGSPTQDVTDRPFRGPLMRPRFSMARHVLPPESSDGCLGPLERSPHRVQGRATMGGFLIRRMYGGCPCVYWDRRSE